MKIFLSNYEKTPNQKEDLCYRSTAAKTLGLTLNQFDKLGLEVAKEVLNPHYKSRPLSKLYDRKTVKSLIDSDEVNKLKTARKKGKPKDYNAIFSKAYDGEIPKMPKMKLEPLTIDRGKFSYGKKLIRWFVNQSRNNRINP